MKGYKTSKDYKHLIELLDKGYEVVCFTTYDWNQQRKDKPDYKPYIVTDICIARLQYKGCDFENYMIYCRGTAFVTYFTKMYENTYTFEELLGANGIEYIEPTEL